MYSNQAKCNHNNYSSKKNFLIKFVKLLNFSKFKLDKIFPLQTSNEIKNKTRSAALDFEIFEKLEII